MAERRVNAQTLVEQKVKKKMNNMHKKPDEKLLPISNLCRAYEDLLRMPNYSDVVIVCGQRSWNCQRAILEQRCQFFRAALSHPFKESRERKIFMNNDDPEAVDTLLLWLYAMRYPHATHGIHMIKFHQMAFSIADKYQVVTLKQIASDAIILWYESYTEAILAGPPDLAATWLFGPIKSMWNMECEGTKKIKHSIIKELVGCAKLAANQEGMLDLLMEERSFLVKYLKALTVERNKEDGKIRDGSEHK